MTYARECLFQFAVQLFSTDLDVSTTNRKINRLHERCLRIIYNDEQSSFKMLLEKDSSVSIHDILPDSYKNLLNLILVFLKTGLRYGNLRIIPAVFVKHAFIESVLHRFPLR